ncbi:hypothetical protein [Alkalihalobacillus sp. LMS39]|uniref:HEAT repeat domain-containing protein n=1 Tax=Alkalihalobacillus sp. LMS39 TaxID=2924032 RepID=UPI001FB46076|nr:hypothetical protein [Alkalihalobacillus sp. LMS39]UOE93115.1 hypothetical protein MM271_18145 [Alkalihalobacillus sp. LMS39]
MISVNIAFVIWINVVLVSILFIILLYLLIQKKKEAIKESRKKLIKQKLRTPLYTYLTEGGEFSTRLLQQSVISYEVLGELLSEYQSLLRKEEAQEKIRQLAEEKLGPYYAKQLQHKRWSIRMNTLHKIEDFKMTMFEDKLLVAIEQDSLSDTETYQMLRTLATFESKPFFNYLLHASQQWPRFIYRDLLRRFSNEWIASLMSEFKTMSLPFQTALLDIIGERKQKEEIAFVEGQLKSELLEVRMAALKAIVQIGYIVNTELIQPFATSSHFEERMMFARIVKLTKKERFKSIVVAMLADSNWWVRNAAGEAVSSFSDGHFLLSYVQETHEDKFAREMAKQWLEGGN